MFSAPVARQDFARPLVALSVLSDADLLPVKRVRRQLRRRESQSGHRFRVRKLPRRLRVMSWHFRPWPSCHANVWRREKTQSSIHCPQAQRAPPRPSTLPIVFAFSFPTEPCFDRRAAPQSQRTVQPLPRAPLIPKDPESAAALLLRLWLCIQLHSLPLWTPSKSTARGCC